MSPEQFKAKMEELEEQSRGDAEVAHTMADALLCDIARDHGYGEGVELFKQMVKWYA